MKIYSVQNDGALAILDESQITADEHFVDVTDLDPIVLNNVLELVKRSRIGVAKYGTTLQDNDHDNFLQHAKEEAMDFINYLEKLKSQNKK